MSARRKRYKNKINFKNRIKEAGFEGVDEQLIDTVYYMNLKLDGLTENDILETIKFIQYAKYGKC